MPMSSSFKTIKDSHHPISSPVPSPFNPSWSNHFLIWLKESGCLPKSKGILSVFLFRRMETRGPDTCVWLPRHQPSRTLKHTQEASALGVCTGDIDLGDGLPGWHLWTVMSLLSKVASSLLPEMTHFYLPCSTPFLLACLPARVLLTLVGW